MAASSVAARGSHSDSTAVWVAPARGLRSEHVAQEFQGVAAEDLADVG